MVCPVGGVCSGLWPSATFERYQHLRGALLCAHVLMVRNSGNEVVVYSVFSGWFLLWDVVLCNIFGVPF